MRAGAHRFAALNALIAATGAMFLVDTHVNYDPTAEQLAEITVAAAEM